MGETHPAASEANVYVADACRFGEETHHNLLVRCVGPMGIGRPIVVGREDQHMSGRSKPYGMRQTSSSMLFGKREPSIYKVLYLSLFY